MPPIQDFISSLSFARLPLGMAAVDLGIHLGLGVRVGMLYFRAVARSAQLFGEAGRPAVALILTMGRLAILGGLMVAVSREGAWPLLVMTLGFLAVRPFALRRALASI